MSLKVLLSPLLSVNLFVIISATEAVRSMKAKILRVSIETAIARMLAISYRSIDNLSSYRPFFSFLLLCGVVMVKGVVFIVAEGA